MQNTQSKHTVDLATQHSQDDCCITFVIHVQIINYSNDVIINDLKGMTCKDNYGNYSGVFIHNVMLLMSKIDQVSFRRAISLATKSYTIVQEHSLVMKLKLPKPNVIEYVKIYNECIVYRIYR